MIYLHGHGSTLVTGHARCWERTGYMRPRISCQDTYPSPLNPLKPHLHLTVTVAAHGPQMKSSVCICHPRPFVSRPLPYTLEHTHRV